MSEISEAIGMRIKLARTERRLSQKELAEQMGLQQYAVSGWETGKRSLRVEEAIKLAELLQVSVAQLAGEQPRAAA